MNSTVGGREARSREVVQGAANHPMTSFSDLMRAARPSRTTATAAEEATTAQSGERSRHGAAK